MQGVDPLQSADALIRAPGTRPRVGLSDPPWSYGDRGKSGSMKPSGAAVNYPTLTVEQIARINVPQVFAPDSLMFMWVTGPHMHSGIRVLKRWGFDFVTVAFTWVKIGTTGESEATVRRVLRALLDGKLERRVVDELLRAAVEQVAEVLLPGFVIGQGSYTRANPEYCLLGKRGAGVPILSRSVRNEVLAPRRAHSQKPDEVADRIVELVGDVPRLEMFARERRPGWLVWGNEVQSDVDLVVP